MRKDAGPGSRREKCGKQLVFENRCQALWVQVSAVPLPGYVNLGTFSNFILSFFFFICKMKMLMIVEAPSVGP